MSQWARYMQRATKIIEIMSFKDFRGRSDLAEMITFIKMVITGVENGSPDMIPVAFERKFDE